MHPENTSDTCNVCNERWFHRNATMNRSGLNCSPECLHREDGYCYEFWDDVAENEETYLRMDSMKCIFVVCYALIFVVGLIGNFLVIFAVCRNRQMRTITNIFLLNLAISDFLIILFCLPPTLVEDLRETWYFGLAMCRITKFLQKLSVFVSVLTLTAIAMERYRAICHILKHRKRLPGVLSTSIVIWIISAAAALPDAILIKLTSVFPECFTSKYFYYVLCQHPDGHQGRIVLYTTVILFFILPLVLIGHAYTRIAHTLWKNPHIQDQVTQDLMLLGNRNKEHGGSCSPLLQRRRTAKMLIIVVIIFFICYFPVHVFAILSMEGVIHYEHFNPQVYTSLYLVIHGLVYLSSSINPAIYNFMSEKFQTEFRSTFACCFRGKFYQIARTHGSTYRVTMNGDMSSSARMKTLRVL